MQSTKYRDCSMVSAACMWPIRLLLLVPEVLSSWRVRAVASSIFRKSSLNGKGLQHLKVHSFSQHLHGLEEEWWGPGASQRQAYLELHGARLRGVEGMEEVMGIRAGICKAQKEKQVMGAGVLQGGVRSLKNSKKEKRMMLGWQKGEDYRVGKTAAVTWDPFGFSGV